jgi:hypothetical protein
MSVLPAPGGPSEQGVMAASGGYFHDPFYVFLTADIYPKQLSFPSLFKQIIGKSFWRLQTG